MSELLTQIEVNVPHGGLRKYSFFGMGYRHSELVADVRKGWAASRGVPFPQGKIRDVDHLLLRDDASGKFVPRQVRPLANWDDGSIMFAHVAFQADIAHDKPATFKLQYDPSAGPSPAPASPVTVMQEDGRVTMDNGPLHCVVAIDGNTPTLSLSRNGTKVFDGPIELWTIDDDGKRYRGVIESADSLWVLEAGPMVATIAIAGPHLNDAGETFLHYELRLRLDAGRDELEFEHQFINLSDNEAGDPVGQIGMSLPALDHAETAQHSLCQAASGPLSWPRLVEFPEPLDIRTTATGPRVCNVEALREDTSEYPSYLRNNHDLVDSWAGIRTSQLAAVTFVVEGSENLPKHMRIADGVIEHHLWPVNAELHELRQGMARTHHVRLAFFAADAPTVDFHRYCYQVESPVNVVVPFEWYQQCEVFGMQYTMPWMPRRYPLIEGILLESPERGWVPGMLGYGDDPNSGYDYSNIGLMNQTVWINNEHDFTSQAMIQFWRSGRRNAYRSARVAAEHQIDVDFVRKNPCRWKQGGIPAHCHQHTTASVYPSHTWTEGLLQYYVSSGDDRALEVAQSLGRNLCQYVEERFEAFETESRMPGWGLIALCAIVEITHDERCLRAARTIRDSVAEVFDRTGAYDTEGMGYATGTLLTGLGQLHRVTNDEEALRVMLGIMDWHMANRRNSMGIVWNDDELGPYNLNLTLPAYAYAYHVTGEQKYRDEGLTLLRFTGPPGHVSDIRGGSKQYRTYVPFLKVAHEAGALDALEARAAIG